MSFFRQDAIQKVQLDVATFWQISRVQEKYLYGDLGSVISMHQHTGKLFKKGPEELQ